MGLSSVTGQETIYFCDNISFDGTPRGGRMVADFESWLGSTSAPHVVKRTFRSPNGTISMVYSTDAGVNYFDWDVDLENIPDLHTYRYIVSAGGAADGANYTTVQDAVDAAVLTGVDQSIWFQDAFITENVTIPVGAPRINFAMCPTSHYNEGTVVWAGKLTLTGSVVGISGILCQNTDDYFLDMSDTGESASGAYFENCTLQTINHDLINAQGSRGLWLNDCFTQFGDPSAKLWVNANGNVTINNNRCDGSYSLSGSTSSSDTNVFISNSLLNFPVTKSSTGIFQLYNSTFKFGVSGQYATALTISGGTDNTIENSYFSTGDQTCLVISATATVSNSSFNTSATNAISGAGTINYANLAFENSSNISTTTQVPLTVSNNRLSTATPSSFPYTVLTQNEVVFVNTSATANTILLPASPVAGQKHTIVDSTGTANIRNITVDGNGKNINQASTFVINLANGSITCVYNGTQWNIT